MLESLNVQDEIAPAEALPFELTAELARLRNLDSEQVRYGLVNFVLPTLGALLIILVGYFVAKFLARLISAPVMKKVDETLGRFVAKFTFYGIMAAVLFGTLSSIGLPLGGLAALVAAGGFAVGLAFQGTLSNFAAGILLLVFRPFKVGDMINAAGIIGKVNEIDLFTVTLDTPDNRRVIVPNSSVSGGIIENMSFNGHRRVEVEVGVAYEASIEQTRVVLNSAAESLRHELIEGPDRGYSVLLDSLGDSAVNWKVRFWTASSEFFRVRELLTCQVKQSLDQASIMIPFPQMDIHFYGQEPPQVALPQRTRPRARGQARSA